MCPALGLYTFQKLRGPTTETETTGCHSKSRFIRNIDTLTT